MRKIYALGNCHVSSSDRSGGDIRFINIMKRLDKVKKIIITSEMGKQIYQEFEIKAEYLTTTTENQVKNIIITYFKRIIAAIFLKVELNEGDIIYSTSDCLPDVFPAFIWKLKNRKVIWIQLIFHLIPSDRLISHYAQKFSFFFIKRFADLIIVDNCLLKEELVTQGFDAKNIEVNPPGINTGYLKDIKSVKEKSYDSCFLGRLHPSKGIFDLIDIWELVLKKKQNAKLAIIGGGNKRLEDEFKKKVMDANLEHNIAIMGYLEDDKAFEILKSSKVFIS